MIAAVSNSSPPPALPARRIYFTCAEIAKVLGWTTERAREWLVREKAVVRHGRHYFTTRGLLRRAFPETWSEVVAAIGSDDG